MRFLFVFVAIFGYAAAGLLAPYGHLGLANPGDVQAAVIDQSVAVQDTARAIHEGQARHAEAVVQANTEAVRQAAESSRDIHENAYWNGLSASQNYVAAAQSQAAAISGAAAAVRAANYPIAAPYLGASPYIGAAPLAYGAPLGLGVHGLGIHGLGLHY